MEKTAIAGARIKRGKGVKDDFWMYERHNSMENGIIH